MQTRTKNIFLLGSSKNKSLVLLASMRYNYMQEDEILESKYMSIFLIREQIEQNIEHSVYRRSVLWPLHRLPSAASKAMNDSIITPFFVIPLPESGKQEER